MLMRRRRRHWVVRWDNVALLFLGFCVIGIVYRLGYLLVILLFG